MKRLVCLRLPHWPVQRLRAERPDLRAGPLLLVQRDPRRGPQVVGCCGRARRAGVRAGMTLAEATVLLPADLRAAAAAQSDDPAGDLAALGRLAAWCERFSPRVGWETVGRSAVSGQRSAVSKIEEPSQPPANHLFLDVSGVSQLFGGEEALAGRIVAGCRRLGYAGRVAVAETLGAAWALAAGPEPVIVPPGGVLPALRPLPVTRLRLPAETADLLSRLGVDTVADLMRLPRAGLAVRFGPPLLLRLDQAIGAVPEIIVPHRPPPVFEAEQELDYPTDRRADIDWVLDHLIDRVTTRLHAHGRGAVHVRAEFRASYSLSASCPLSPSSGPLPPSLLVPSPLLSCPLPPWGEGLGWGGAPTPHPNPPPQGGRGPERGGRGPGGKSGRGQEGQGGRGQDIAVIEVPLYRPTDLAKPLRELLRLHCDRLVLSGPVDRIRLTADQTIPLRPRQVKLFADPAEAVAGPLAELLERLSSRLGPIAVVRPVRQPDPLPERAVRWAAVVGGGRRGRGSRRAASANGSAGASPSRPLAVGHRPLRLFAPPVPVDVTAVANGPPAAFRWRRERHAVVRWWGPERIESGWWRGELVRRDYYRVETDAGRRFWLFRELHGRGWFLHGSFG